MANPKSKLSNSDPVPKSFAGVETIGCDCGWEAVFLMPEENHQMITAILEHIRTKHELPVPQLYGVHH